MPLFVSHKTVARNPLTMHNHILIKLPHIYSYRKACNFFPNCMLFVAWGTSEIARCCGACYPIRSSSTLVTSVGILATPLLHWQRLKMAAVWALVLFTTRMVSLFLSRRNAMGGLPVGQQGPPWSGDSCSSGTFQHLKDIIKFITRCAQAKASSESGRDYTSDTH